jgi:allophanate hydrolase
VAGGFDKDDPWSRRPVPSPRRGWSQRAKFRCAVPLAAQREFFGNAAYAHQFESTIDRLAALGAEVHELDISPLLEAAQMLYQGPWVAERYQVAGPLAERDPDAVLRVIRDIIGGAIRFAAHDAFAAQYRLQELRRDSEAIWDAADVLLLPTAPTHYRIDEIEADPLRLNSRLGHYTNFVNLLDLAAVAVPAGFTSAGLPFGVSLIAPAHEDADLLHLAARLHRATSTRAGAMDAALPPRAPLHDNDGFVDVAVCGAHMTGLPLNVQLTARGGWLVESTRTAPEYRLFALPGGPPLRPGLVRVGEGGAAIEIEVWRLPLERFGDFVAGIPAPLGIGRLRTASEDEVCGFLCETAGLASAEDITRHGGWRAWLSSR